MVPNHLWRVRTKHHHLDITQHNGPASQHGDHVILLTTSTDGGSQHAHPAIGPRSIRSRCRNNDPCAAAHCSKHPSTALVKPAAATAQAHSLPELPSRHRSNASSKTTSAASAATRATLLLPTLHLSPTRRHLMRSTRHTCRPYLRSLTSQVWKVPTSSNPSLATLPT